VTPPIAIAEANTRASRRKPLFWAHILDCLEDSTA
jgi:hypothetical protein